MTLRSIVIPSGGGGGGGITNINVSAGAASANLSNIVFSNSNGVSFGLNGSTITGSIAAAGGGSINFSAGTTSNLLTNITFADSNGVSFGLNASTVTGTVKTAYVGLNTAQTNVVWTVNSSGISLNASGYAGTGFTSTTTAGTAIVATNNTAGLSMGVPVYITTQTNQSAIKGLGASNTGNTAGNTGISTGIDWVIAGSNNITISESTAGGGPNTLWISGPNAGAANYSVGVSTGGNTRGNTGVTGTQIVFAGIGGNTLSQATDANGATVSISGPGYTLSSYEPYGEMIGFATGVRALSSSSAGTALLFPFNIMQPVSAGIMNMFFSASFSTLGTSTGSQTYGIQVGIYTRNASTLSSIWSQSVSYQVSGNNSSYTINQVTATSYSGYGATAATNSAGSAITSGYTGPKLIGFPINSLLTPGHYWLGILQTASSSSTSVGIMLSFVGGTISTAVAGTGFAPMGSFSSAYTTGFQPFGQGWAGAGAWSSAGSVTALPVSADFASISQSNASINLVPRIQFWST